MEKGYNGGSKEWSGIHYAQPGSAYNGAVNQAVLEKMKEGEILYTNDLESVPLPNIASTIVSFMTSLVSPLVSYRVARVLLSVPLTISDVRIWIDSKLWDAKEKDFFFKVFDHLKTFIELEETVYYRKTMIKFYADAGIDEKIKDVEMNLEKFKDREVVMFTKLSSKYNLPNPCEPATMPAGLLAKRFGKAMVRKSEDPQRGKVRRSEGRSEATARHYATLLHN